MCFLNIYTCKISCLNQDLNITAAMNRSIEGSGIAQACKVESCELTGHLTEGYPIIQSSPVYNLDPWVIPLVLCVLIPIVIGLMLLNKYEEKKE